MTSKARHRMTELINEIRDHQFKYYVLDLDELSQWFDRVEKEISQPQYLCEVKVDGLAINLSLIHI